MALARLLFADEAPERQGRQSPDVFHHRIWEYQFVVDDSIS